jgi:hypothetical protein
VGYFAGLFIDDDRVKRQKSQHRTASMRINASTQLLLFPGMKLAFDV